MAKDVYFDSGLQGWIVRTAYKEHWRVAFWYEPDDLIQDGYVAYCKCRDKYTLKDPEPGHPPLNTDNPSPVQRRHFMSLVQTAYVNHIMTLAAKFAMGREDPIPVTVEEDERGDSVEKLLPPEPEAASVMMAIATAPAEIKEAIERVINDGLGDGEYLRTQIYRRGGRVHRIRRTLRETTAQYWDRVLGTPDLPEKLSAYLHS